MEVKLDKNICYNCKYSCPLNSSFKQIMCNYISITGRSRIYNLGKKEVEKGYCNKYEERTEQ